MTDYTDPSTIDVDEVMANIDMSYRVRGHRWTAERQWPNVTVKALADEVNRLRQLEQVTQQYIAFVDSYTEASALVRDLFPLYDILRRYANDMREALS